MCMAASVGADVGKDRIAIVQKISGRVAFRKRVAELLRGPGRRGVLGDRDVDDSATVVSEDDEYEQQRPPLHADVVGGID